VRDQVLLDEHRSQRGDDVEIRPATQLKMKVGQLTQNSPVFSCARALERYRGVPVDLFETAISPAPQRPGGSVWLSGP
jgi:hypothetical protein